MIPFFLLIFDIICYIASFHHITAVSVLTSEARSLEINRSGFEPTSCTAGEHSSKELSRQIINYSEHLHEFSTLCWNFITIYGGEEPNRKRNVVPIRQAT